MNIKIEDKIYKLEYFQTLKEKILDAEKDYENKDFFSAYNKYLILNNESNNEFEDELKKCEKLFNINKDIDIKKAKELQPSKNKNILNKYFDNIYVVNLKKELGAKLTVSKHLNQNNIKYEIFEATNGYEDEDVIKKWEEYSNKNLGNFKYFKEHSHLEINRNHQFISSQGAMGYIFTYLKILEDMKSKKYKKILILEDDVILDMNFENKFNEFIEKVDSDWKILLLGASQYGWDKIDIEKSIEQKFYNPINMETCGSFAIAIDESVVEELIEVQKTFESPFDFFSIGSLYEKYNQKCFVSYPNIIMPDVTSSNIRNSRNQIEHSNKMKWEIDSFEFPSEKVSIAILIESEDTLRYFTNFKNKKENNFHLNVYFNSIDGIRSVHDNDIFDKIKNDIIEIPSKIILPENDFYVKIKKENILYEEDIINFIEYKMNLNLLKNNTLEEIKVFNNKIIKDRISIIIPTYSRTKNLRSSILSIINRDYKDIELIVVDDNEKYSKYNYENKEMIFKLLTEYNFDNISLVYIEHNRNRNGASARNSGIFKSTGEYISFLDDDDIYLEGKIKKSIEKLKDERNGNNAVYTGFTGWNSTENNLGRYKEGDLTEDILTLNYTSHYLCTNTVTYKRKSIIEINGFNESYRRHQDLEFNLRYFQNNKIKTIKETLVKLSPNGNGDIDNRIFGINMLNLKNKFLYDFRYLIEKFDPETQIKIKYTHFQELNNYINDKKIKNQTKIKKNIKIKKNGAIDIIKNHLSYKIGNTLFHQSNIFNFPFKIYKVMKNHKKIKSQNMKEFKDYEESLLIKEQLSYKFGNEIVKCKKNIFYIPLLLILLPLIYIKKKL